MRGMWGRVRGAVRPLIAGESFFLSEKLEVRSGGAAHKKTEAPLSINRAMSELCFFPPSFGRRCPEGAEVGLGLFSLCYV